MSPAEWAVRLLARSGRAGGRAARRVAGPRADTTIDRDTRGVPTVRADTEPDLYFGIGYAQACDRLWQMDVLRRRAAGRLSEVLGAATVADDVRARKLGLTRVAAASEAALPAEAMANLRAFSAGVNAAIRRFRRRVGLPPEFVLLRYRPEPWTPLDSVLIVKQLGFDLGLNLKYEVFRGRLAAERPEHLDTLGTSRYPADGPVTVRTHTGARPAPPPRPVEVLADSSRAWLNDVLGGEHAIGSNAWVISGTRTASGFPLLANDPHVAFTQPSLWYQLGLRLTGADGTVSTGYGVTVPGIPGLIAGANAGLAWGITNSTVDTQDLCALPAEAPGGWAQESTVGVRGGDPVPVRAAGGDGYVEFDPPGGPARCGLFWSGFTPSSEIQACQRMWLAESYVDFREVLRLFGVPVLNVAVATRDGTIALKTAGRVPLRVRGSGAAPGRFADVAASWERFVEFDDLPEAVDPPSGYLVTANHKLLPDGAHLDLGADWAAPYRARRIEELIETTPTVTADDCARWQLDDLDGRARRVLPALLAALDEDPPASPPAATCHTLLSTWDCRDTGASAAPLVFARLLLELADGWVGGALGEDLAAVVPDLPLQVDHLILHPDARAALGVDEPLTATAARALHTVGTRLAGELGDDPAGWRYDAVHRIVDPHPLGRAGAALRAVFCAPPTPVGGGGHTVCLMGTNRAGEVIEGAPWRFVAELAPTGTRVRDVLRHGSSGHPRSPHYRDQTAAHARGDLPEAPLPPHGEHTLVLRSRSRRLP